MKKNISFLIVLILSVTVITAGCNQQPRSVQVQDERVEAAAVELRQEGSQVERSLTPEGIAQLFYSEYIASGRAPEASLADGYRNSPYLSQAYIEQVDEIYAGFEGFGFDPILYAQDLPESIKVVGSEEEGSSVRVDFEMYYSGSSEPSQRKVYLEEIEGSWLIVPPPVKEDGLSSPEAVVLSFYDWYISYLQPDEQGNFRSPMADQAYLGHPLLTYNFQQRADEMRSIPGGIGYDPFLCAQEVPPSLAVQSESFNNGRPTLQVGYGDRGYNFTVELIRADFNLWQINKVICNFDH